jgi:PAS domain S-box-containing protein
MNNRGTVMVVDDTLASLKLLTTLLTGEGYQVLPANSGELALASVAANPPELILLDILMPGMDGFEVIRRLKAHKVSSGIPVIFLSAVTEVDQRVEGLKLGAVDFISKPFQREELLARVRTQIDLCRLRTRAEKQAIELQRANDQLQIEIGERKEAEEEVRRARDFYLKVLDDFPNPIWRSDIHAKCDYFNKDWLLFTGRSIEQELGDGWAEGVHPDDLERCVKIYLDHFHAKKPFEMDYRLRYHDGTYRWLYDCGKPLFTLDGEFAGYIGSCYDIHDRRMAEEEIRLLNVDLEKRVAERTADLQEALASIEKSLNEKVVMLREIHHRVKNNLQIIISLLNLQSRQFSDPQIRDAIRESQNRVRAISMVHEQIFISSDIENIDLGAYIHSLATNLFSFYKLPTERVHIHTTMENITTNIDTAVPLGLIINELFSNAIRHAFPGERAGKISITGTDTGGMLEIRVMDNGIGMPPAADPEGDTTLGLKLVHILSDQLNGTVEFLPPPGTTVVLRIPKKEG